MSSKTRSFADVIVWNHAGDLAIQALTTRGTKATGYLLNGIKFGRVYYFSSSATKTTAMETLDQSGISVYVIGY